MAILVRASNSSNGLPLQPVAARSYMAILVTGCKSSKVPIAAQLLHNFTHYEQFTPSLLQHFTPLVAQLLVHFTSSEKINPKS